MKTGLFSVLAFCAWVSFASGCAKRTLDGNLIGASGTGNVQEIRRLLTLGANVNCREGSLVKATPLISAMFECQDEAALVLLAAGADPNIPDGRGKMPLFYALMPGNHSAVIRALVAAGAQTSEYAPMFLDLPKDDVNRVAFEEAVAERARRGAHSQAAERNGARDQ